jgi:hypothetical protein
MKDQPMLKFRLLTLALAGASMLTARCGTIITENFSANPLRNGWKVFGDTNLFQWDSTNQDLRVTWDSSQPNSYFYHPLGTILARADDFSMAFDLQLADIGPGLNTNMPYTFEIALGFLNLDQATQTNFLRGTGVNSPDLAEFAYFWDAGYGATAYPTFVDTNNTFNWNAPTDYAIYALTNGVTYHVVMAFTASNQIATATITNSQQTSGVLITQLLNSSFADFRLDTFSVSSYSDAGQAPGEYAGSVLAHGVVDNIVVVVPPPPVENLTGSFSNRVWQAQFNGRATWVYTLQRTTDFQSWTDVSPVTSGGSGPLVLSDLAPPVANAFYRIRANRP